MIERRRREFDWLSVKLNIIAIVVAVVVVVNNIIKFLARTQNYVIMLQ